MFLGISSNEFYIGSRTQLCCCDWSTTPKSEMLVGLSCFPSAAPPRQVQLLVIAHTAQFAGGIFRRVIVILGAHFFLVLSGHAAPARARV